MNWIRRKSAEPRRLGRPALLAAAAVAVMLLGACSSEPGAGGNGNGASGNSAAVQLNPASGPISSTPTWSTNSACPTGYRGSAVFRIVQPNRLTSLSQATNSVTAPFHGTLLASIATIQSYANIPKGGSAELVVMCYSGDSLTGNPHFEMTTYLTFSSDGQTYTTSATAPAGFTPPALPSVTS